MKFWLVPVLHGLDNSIKNQQEEADWWILKRQWIENIEIFLSLFSFMLNDRTKKKTIFVCGHYHICRRWFFDKITKKKEFHENHLRTGLENKRNQRVLYSSSRSLITYIEEIRLLITIINQRFRCYFQESRYSNI